jgi:hypothetical protein
MKTGLPVPPCGDRAHPGRTAGRRNYQPPAHRGQLVPGGRDRDQVEARMYLEHRPGWNPFRLSECEPGA